MKQNKLRTLYEKDMTKKILASLLSILIGLVVGSVIIAAVGFSNPELGASSVWDGIRIVFAGLFSTGRTAAGVLTWGFNSTNFGNMLFRATPLIMTGLSVAVAFKTGLFNIGAPGQYLMGTLVSLCIALGIPSSSVAPWLIWILAFLGGVAAGALWGAIPGALKAFLNINEVLASIMTNWLAANLVTWMFDISNFIDDDNCITFLYSLTYICFDLEYFSGCSGFYFDGSCSTCRCCLRCCWCCRRSCLRCCCRSCNRCCTCSVFFYCYIIYIAIHCDCIIFH